MAEGARGPADTLGSRIAEHRERRGWTQRKLAEESGLSPTFISEVENDKRNLGSEALLRIANALGASIDYLLRGEESPEAPRQPLVLPPELAAAAERKGWSVGHAADLVRARQIVIERRTKSGDRLPRHPDWSMEDWLAFEERLFGGRTT